MAQASPRVVYRMATGGLVWAIPGSSLNIMWAGTGARLQIGFQLLKAGSTASPIHHPSADGHYRTAKEATAAVKRFLAAGGESGNSSRASRAFRAKRRIMPITVRVRQPDGTTRLQHVDVDVRDDKRARRGRPKRARNSRGRFTRD